MDTTPKKGQSNREDYEGMATPQYVFSSITRASHQSGKFENICIKLFQVQIRLFISYYEME